MSYLFDMSRCLISGAKSSLLIANPCKTLSISKALIVTDSGIAKLGLHKSVMAALEADNIDYVVFSDVEADPSDSTVEKAIGIAREHEIDGVIGFGGGSSMDVAKVIAVMMNSKQALSDIYGIDQVTGSRLPLIQVPTTAGTGSEVTPISILTTGATTKSGIVAAQLLPDIAILDPELTLGLPAHVTAATGIDAMVHAIEAFTTQHKKNDYSDMLAKQALALLAGNIETAVHDGSNSEARMAMLRGACIAGQAFANAPVAAVHALAYPLGGIFHIPHGLSNSLVLPHVMRFNASKASALYAELALIIIPDFDASNLNDEQITDRLISYVETLIPSLNLPTTLMAMGIDKSDIPRLASDAMKQTRLLVNNPREVTEADALDIYNAAFA